MPDQPLQPFAPPTALFKQFALSGAPSSGVLVEWTLLIIFAFWAIYTLIAIYHWLKYSHASWVAVPAIAVHLFISFALMSYALSGNAFSLTPYLP
ncbi:MAG: hypothetical protein PHD04_00495 [Candidatus Pacebacteria bacterium]|nr:hypothetical protein [Candidatus Paceibacterota bacterium]